MLELATKALASEVALVPGPCTVAARCTAEKLVLVGTWMGDLVEKRLLRGGLP